MVQKPLNQLSRNTSSHSITLKSPNRRLFVFHGVNKLIQIYRQLNVLSIDVALGAMCSSAWLASLFLAQIRIYAYCALGLTVWIIYTIDHLLDAYRIKHRASSYRHQFHQKHFQVLMIAVVLALITDIIFVFFIRSSILYSGFLLSIVIAVYLVFNRWLSYLKECFAAILYCGGVLLPIASVVPLQELYQNIIVISSFFITALLNIVLFSWFDIDIDRRDNQLSLVSKSGDLITRKLIGILFMTQLLIIAFGAFMKPTMIVSFIVLLVMNGVLAIIFFKWRTFAIRDRYRLVGDAIFLFPLFQLLLK